MVTVADLANAGDRTQTLEEVAFALDMDLQKVGFHNNFVGKQDKADFLDYKDKAEDNFKDFDRCLKLLETQTY